jgi:hypothetical protein
MARPKPTIHLTKDTGTMTYDVLNSQGVWALFYQGSPVSYRQHWTTVDGLKFKYPRTCFNNPGHCQRLADKLNRMFKCQDFTCHELLVKQTVDNK